MLSKTDCDRGIGIDGSMLEGTRIWGICGRTNAGCDGSNVECGTSWTGLMKPPPRGRSLVRRLCRFDGAAPHRISEQKTGGNGLILCHDVRLFPSRISGLEMPGSSLRGRSAISDKACARCKSETRGFSAIALRSRRNCSRLFRQSPSPHLSSHSLRPSFPQ